MVVADLHVHTTNSDGTLTLERVEAVARTADLAAVAITDHDRLHPGLEDGVVDRGDLTVVHGIELRVATGRQRVDLLGYGASRTGELVELVERLQRDRVARGRAMVERVEDHLGRSLAVTIEPGFGRPDVARAVASHPDTRYDVQDVFDELIGTGDPCYVPRDVPSFDRGRRILRDACDLVGLAHPLRYEDPQAALGTTEHLDAVERWYPYSSPVDARPVDRAIERYDLLPTGGSDAHDDVLGVAGLDGPAWERVLASLDGVEA